MDVVNPEADPPSFTGCASFGGSGHYQLQYCTNAAGSNNVSFAFAPRRGSLAGGDPGVAPVDSPDPATRITAPTYRCLCRKSSLNFTVAINNAECSPLNIAGVCAHGVVPVGFANGLGWLAAQMIAPQQGYGGTFATVRHNAVPGVTAPRFYAPSNPTSFANAASLFRTNESGAARLPVWRWTWFPSSNANPLPTDMPLAAGPNVPASAFWPRVMFRNRFETLTDPVGNPTLEQAQRVQDHYTGVPASMINRYDRVLRTLPDWALGAQAWWLFQNIHLVRGPRPDPDPYLSREHFPLRYLAAIFPIDATSSPNASDGFFPNGNSGNPVRGVVIARLDVRQSWIQNTAISTGAANDLPTNASASYTVTQLDQEGWGDVWAFGGVGATGALSNELFYTTHTVDASGFADFVWHRASSTTPAPSIRRDSTIVANANGTRIYVVGGRNGSNVYSDVPYYDVPAQQWSSVALSVPMGARYHAGVAVKGDTLYVGEGVGVGGTFLGDLVRVNGLTGETYSYGNVLPAGAAPDLSFDDHGDGLIFGGGYYGATWYRDIWKVSVNEVTASSSFVYDFGWSGLGPSENYVVVSDIEHDLFWGVPGYAATGNPGGTYFLIDGQASQVPVGGGGGLLRVAGGGQPDLQRGPPGTPRTRPRATPVATVARPTPTRGVVR